ncbi:MAG: PilC/PilY family type IV pilus protein [Rhodoferax sp.]|nr:PilC/PilY family type IV pilus protein [Rhodoferax sp.]
MKNMTLPKALTCVALLLVCQAHAGITDIANVPLFTSSGSSVKSNIMFVLDDSGSMDWDYLPDDSPQSDSGKYGYLASQCNGVAYNPAISYKAPIKADGTFFNAASFSAAKSDGFNSGSSAVNLGGKYYYRYKGTQTAMSYQYTTSGLVTSSTFYKECNSSVGSSPGNGVFDKITLQSSSAESQNYANWYSFYSTRMQMMKSATGLAFSTIDSRYRVGFKSIDNKLASGTTFLDIKDFDATQKALFYSKLYSAKATGYTPLRGALATAGQYFANKAPGQSYDPVQYSCQKNFTILSTDGYWNTNSESSTYGPFQLNNTTRVGQQDGGGTPRPLLDGGTTRTTTTSQWNSTAVTKQVVTTTTTKTDTSSTPVFTGSPVKIWSKTSYTLGPLAVIWKNTDISRCSSGTSGTCIITVKTEKDHGFSDGMSVTIAGVDPSDYNGTFTITRKDKNEFTYSLPNRPADKADSDKFGTSSTGGTCPAGKGQLSAQAQTRTEYSGSTVTTTATTTTLGTTATTKTTTAVTPKTQVVIYDNGILVSDVTTSGTTTTTSPSTSSLVWGTPAATTSTTTTSGSQYTNWVNSGTPVTSCATSMPSSPETSTSTSGSTVVVPGTVISDSTSSNGTPSTITTGPVLSTSTPTSSTNTTSTGGSTDSLADVSMYYYSTDLRTSALGNCTGSLGTDVCANNVAGGSSDIASWQHMTTYTLGLGNSGLLRYDPLYLTQTSGDYFDIKQGTKNWPIPDGEAANIDDLWHAAVDGRGKYFSAKEPTSLATGLSDALDAIRTITGTAAAAATSSLQPVQGDNDIYVGQFTSNTWSGDVSSYKIDPSTGVIAPIATWSAQALLDNLTYTDRKIYYAVSAGNLKLFNDSNLSSDSLQSYFSNFCSKTGASGSSAPTQCSTLSTSDQTIANTSANLVNYLRGAKTYAVYRSRDHVLGDVVNASPLFVGKPSFKYVENGYATFAANASGRTAMVYVAANDGMLHVFDRVTGAERWAYVPKPVLPNLYKLADTGYSSSHFPMLDGSPVMGDIYVSGAWKTILLGGMNAGGRSYYALDVTDPTAPKMLWEFSDANLGLTFGNPIITKKSDGTWVVVFASGYNNVSPGDGNGHLFVVNANTGAKILDIPTYSSGTTAVGSTAAPSGLAKINAYISSDQSNVAELIYGGDLLGNVWRFDINSMVAPYLSSMLLAQLKVGSTPQPITTKPALAEISYSGTKVKTIYIGTGKYLGTSDLADTSTQTIYALKDTRSSTGLGNVRSATDPAGNAMMVAQTATNTTSASLGNIVQVTASSVNWNTKSGWYVDLPGAGERVNIAPHLVLSTLFVGTNTPKTDACTVGGTSMLYQLDINNGGAAGGSSKAAATSLGNVLVMGMTTVLTGEGSGAGKVTTIVTRSDGTLGRETGDRPTVRGVLKRTSWRVLK